MGEQIGIQELFKEFIIKSQNKFLEDEISQWYRVFTVIFLQIGEGRLPYGDITDCIYSVEEDPKLEIIKDNLTKIIEKSNEESKDENIKKSFERFEDHVHLAITQREFILKNVAALERKVRPLDIAVKDASKQVKLIIRSKAKIYAEFVSILGIFTGIVIGVMGSLQTISSVFSHINSVPTGKLLAFSSLTAMGVITIIFLLMKLVSNIVVITFEEEIPKSSLRAVIARNYVYFMSILVLFYFFILGGVLYFDGLKDFFSVLFGNPVIPFIVIVAIPLVIFNIGYFLIKEKKNE
ncbi:hypothetical protein GWJ21_04140 [Bacillus coagulans]|uniref:hypothetical protein n=1 Tax=Heyndrickxia coagulans TaxID=1398 RepID=UPI0013765447|nr:hypothetical protein [Heyndrickxia coagulans]NCG67156.1 hypothetical protein [Heyndrickxia coagulans]